ncbi:RusA family crossover junction endodeoxyribonuclease [Georgenia sp. MJ206]|uniref:RusA family crossover junction endodeoxyribonuclease n=1 Tax=Georgenia wangjunii TaxID=3117730 RepID=UPI002F268AA8
MTSTALAAGGLVLELWVPGLPGAQGSKRYVGHRDGKPLLLEQSKAVAPWRALVTSHATLALARHAARRSFPLTGPVSVDVEFRVPRPPSVSVADRPLPIVPPDLDKLTRALFDALTQAKAWRDDSLVVTLTARKTYAQQPQPGGHDGPGAHITITPLEDPR